MATAMQRQESAATIQNVGRVQGIEETVSEERFRNAIIYKNNRKSEDVDADLVRYGDIWHEEVIRRAKKRYASKWCFSASVTTGAMWASELLPLMPLEYSKVRKMLAKIVVDGWLGCKDLADESKLAQVLRSWPGNDSEEKLIADAIREIFEFRSNDNPSQKIARLFGEWPGSYCNRSVIVAMLIAGLKWAGDGQLEDMGMAYYFLVDSEHSKDCEARRRELRDTLQGLFRQE